MYELMLKRLSNTYRQGVSHGRFKGIGCTYLAQEYVVYCVGLCGFGYLSRVGI